MSSIKFSALISKDQFSSSCSLPESSETSVKIPSARHFSKVNFSCKTDLVFYGSDWDNLSLDFLGDIVSFLSKYVLTKGDCQQIFSFVSGEEVYAPLEKFRRQELLRDIQKISFSRKLNDELIRLVFQLSKIEKYLSTGESKFALIPDPEKSTIQNIRLLSFRTIEYLKNIFQDNIPNFACSLTDKNFVLVENNLIYLSTDSKNFLSNEIVQKIYYFYSEGLKNKVEKLIIFNPRFNTEYSLKLIGYWE